MLVHRSFKTYKTIEYIFVIGAYLAWQGSPIGWCAQHKLHHRTVDTEFDPHTPRKGFFYSLIGWLFHRNLTREDFEKLTPYMMSDPFYRFLGCETFPDKPMMNFLTGVFFRIILFLLFGWKVALASFLAGGLAFWAPQLVNSVCHMPRFGYKNYPNQKDDSVNVPWLIPLTMSESLHSNHHKDPRGVSQAHFPGELDISYLFIVLLEKLGLAWNLVK